MSELRVDEVDLRKVPGLAASPGRLGMTFLPGKQGVSWSGQRHDRDLDADAATLRRLGVDALVLLVEDHELVDWMVPSVVERLATHGVETVRFPIKDMDVPSDPMEFAALLDTIEARLADRKFVAVACLGGLGRTGTVVGCLLAQNGLHAWDAVVLTREEREGTIQTRDQEEYVGGWRRIAWSDRETEAGETERCPRCGSHDVAKIQYGYPRFDEELEHDVGAGEIALGGCVIGGDMPEYECNACHLSFGEWQGFEASAT